MLTQTQFNRQKRRAKRRSEKATETKKSFRWLGAHIRICKGEAQRNLWHPENW